jgi:hypothetical protein
MSNQSGSTTRLHSRLKVVVGAKSEQIDTGRINIGRSDIGRNGELHPFPSAILRHLELPQRIAFKKLQHCIAVLSLFSSPLITVAG